MGERRYLRLIDASGIGGAARGAVDPGALADAEAIVARVRAEGESAVREYGERFGEVAPGGPLVLGRGEMLAALDEVPREQRGVLERAAERVGQFANAQREAIRPVTMEIPGGEAGHTIEPIEAAGCYAPGGRYPLPSSALMTAIPARVAGCRRVVVASPGAHPLVVGAAAIAGADEFLVVGGAHGIAAMAFGFGGFAGMDFVAGPGNRWVTAAKHVVSREVGIDMLAGPSELLVLADETADASLVAADLLAQAEHDDDARPMLVTTSEALAEGVERAIGERLAGLPTRATAERALGNGFACVVATIGEAVRVAGRLAPEHLEVMTRDAPSVAAGVRHAGAVFIGGGTAEALGDYGAGPNHTLPTGGTARHQAGLSVASFLRLRTWIRIDDAGEASGLARDAAAFAEMESLPGHAASAEARVGRA